ncbi:MAG: membrane c-type cytochrome cy [uncultured Sulfurovum sp.]|uniref:Membrane c-type cytochrome cy n=1 Tax=uncultured Sulfurovum sp. TaxID=269237 RepID=A0A6S6SXS5_9BACT|nr:MAG: membrane c-type cytochrome cy [uncultured Sulfurovum sp.]
MFKLDRKLTTIGMVLVAGVTFSTMIASASESKDATSATVGTYASKSGALDGGVTYPRENGTYTAYKYNTQSTKGVNPGRPATANEIKAWDLDALPDGTGLPEGEGSVELGDELYEAQCAVCHGEFGAGGSGYPQLAGGNMDKDENGVIITLKNQRVYGSTDAPKRTVGTYWPVATTLFTYIRDSMPYAHPKSLSNDEVYAITAYILAQNEIEIDGEEMDDEYVLNKEKLSKVVLPNRNGFYPNIDGPNAIEDIRAFYADRAKNIGAGTRCMTDCKDPGGIDGKTPAGVMKIKYEMSDVTPPYAYDKSLPPKKEDKNAHPGKAGYETSCLLCHKTDAMGAPAVGDKAGWEIVMKKGLDKVYHNTIHGINGMPAKGGTSLPDDEIKKIVDYMIEASK